MKKILLIIFLAFLLFIKYEEYLNNRVIEKYVGNEPYLVEHTDPLFVRYREQHKLTFKRNKDKVKNRFLYDQEDASDDYQIHAIYMLASDSSDKKLDVNGFIPNKLVKGPAIVFVAFFIKLNGSAIFEVVKDFVVEILRDILYY